MKASDLADGRRKDRDPIAFLEEVQAALFARLDQAFPEFGWERDGRGWRATDDTFTKETLGARRARVVCHNPAGFLIFGGENRTWLAYVNGGSTPRGADFFEALRKLAGLAGVDASVLDREPTPEELARHEAEGRRRGVLEAVGGLAQTVLRSDRGAAARAYLTGPKRGLSDEDIGRFGLGLYPTVAEVRTFLEREAHDIEAAQSSGLLWAGIQGYITVPWADAAGRPLTLYGRWPGDPPEGKPKTIALPGAGTKGVPLYLDRALKAGHKDLVAVEGVFDGLLLQARGDSRAVAYAGAQFSAEQVRTLARHKVRSVVVAPDPDGGGDRGAGHSVEALERAGLAAYVAPRLPDGLDPDEFLRRAGLEGWKAHVRAAAPGAVFRGARLLEGITPVSPEADRRPAVDRVLELTNALGGPHAALDREGLLRLLAARTGWSFETLAELAEDRAGRLRDEELERATRKAVRDAQEALAKKEPARAVADRLAGELDAARAKTLDVPPPFSVARLEAESAALPAGKSLGWRAVDALDVELRPAELAVLAGRTGHGKTTVLVNVFANLVRAAASEGTDEVFVFYSAEEPELRIYHRLLALVTALETGGAWTVNEVRDFLQGRDRRGHYPAADTLDAAREILRSWEDRVRVVHRPGWTVAELEAHARGLATREAVGGVLVDYLQRIYPPKDFGKGRRRDEEVSAVARRLKVLAEDLAAPVVAGAQINRRAVEEGGRIPDGASYEDKTTLDILKARRPHLHHLREGGSEQEADLVLGVMNYAADFTEEAGRGTVPAVTRLEMGSLKNRSGPPGRWAALDFDGRYGYIIDASHNASDRENIDSTQVMRT